MNYDYNNLNFNVYKLEVGVLLNKDNCDYDCYNNVYDKKHAYFDENTIFTLDYNDALEHAKNYVNEGVNGTYAIISKLFYNGEELHKKDKYLDIDYTMHIVNEILGGGYIDDYDLIFDHNTLYGVDNVVYSLYKVRNEDFPYHLGKGYGDIVENFIKNEVK